MNTKRYYISSEAEMLSLGQRYATILQPGELVVFEGPIGSGKTTIIRSIIRAILQNQELVVPSPTFTILQVYEDWLYHLDLYRLTDQKQVIGLGLEDYLQPQNLVMVEWPKLLLPLYQPSYLVTIEFETQRRVVTWQRISS